MLAIERGADVTERIRAFLDSIQTPDREFGPHPFWFWNDDIDEEELLRQLQAFYDAGVGGVVIHPRTGLSRRVGYLTEAYFRLVRRVVRECARLGMKVVLYDECSYPSGSASGRVVAENPDYAARALAFTDRAIEGPTALYWRPHLSRSLVDRLVSVSVARLIGEEGGVQRIDPETLRLLEFDERGLVRLDVGEGRWLAMACIDTPSGGRIRGAHGEEDDGMALAPPAGDLMNPEAVSAFVRLTHEAYSEHLKDHFGTTVVAMFTDEPSPLGRGAKRNVRPFTNGFDAYLQAQVAGESPALLAAIGGDVRAWLPALWVDFGPHTAAFRETYERAVHRRVVDVFYRAQADWCQKRGIALTGHPSESNDMASLSTFDWPGQDMVWRWVVPGNQSGLHGQHSVAPKAATSAARATGKRRIASELLGAYGWKLTLDEAKWLIDWHLVRGNNFLMPHAYFYSVRGGRAFESEPDLFLHNAWRPYAKLINEYIARVCSLLTDCEHVCDVAVLGEGRALPWRAAAFLYTSQVDFLYIDEAQASGAEVDSSRGLLRVGKQAYRVVIVDGRPPLGRRAKAVLADFKASGGLVLDLSDCGDGCDTAWIEQVRARSAAAVRPDGSIPDLRVMRVRKSGLEGFFLTNEGESALSGVLTLPVRGRAAWYDPLTDETCEASLFEEGASSAKVAVELERRASRLLLVDPDAPPALRAVEAGVARSGENRVALSAPGPWTVSTLDGAAVDVPAPGDWCAAPDLERFSGTLCYRTTVALDAIPRSVEIDLGMVGDIAEVYVNGSLAGVRLWAPYRIVTRGVLWRAGSNTIEARITNSSANAYEGALRPSGLFGPVRLFIERP